MLAVLLVLALVGCKEDPQEISWFLDADEDGYGTPDDWVLAAEQPEGYVRRGTDCNDNDPDVNPAALEYCNSRDDDCDGEVDEEAVDRTTWYLDVDADDHGVAGDEGVLSCIRLDDTTNGPADDCDDSDPDVRPGAVEVCNDVDDDCNGEIDDGLCYCWPTPLGSEADAQWTGEESGAEAGYAVGPSGDFDGDGMLEAVVGSPGLEDGRVYLVGEGTGRIELSEASRVILGDGGRFGAAVASGVDVSGDGYADLVVGAPTWGEPEDEDEEPVDGIGRAYLFRGPSGGTLYATDAWATWDASPTDTGVGTVVLLADLGAGEEADVVLATTEQLLISWPETGSGELSEDVFAVLPIPGVQELARADLDGDGQDDLVVGVPDEGAVYVIPGPLAGIYEAGDFLPMRQEGGLGAAVTVGDVNDDGQDDLALGDPEASSAGGVRSGMVYVYLGGDLGEPVAQIAGAQAGDGAGSGLAMQGDLDGDRVADLVVVAQDAEDGGRESGSAWLVSGGAGLTGVISLGDLGQGWTGLGTDELSDARSDLDIDGDGLLDLVLGAPGNDLGETNSGGAYVILGCR